MIKPDQAEFINMVPLSGVLGLIWKLKQFKKVSKVGLISWPNLLSKDGLLKRRWRCLASLDLVLMQGF